jgi:nitrite reductase (cytochrome c-552)
MKSLSEQIKQKPWIGWVLFISTAVVVFILGLLASSIIERRTEASFLDKPLVKIGAFEPRNSEWGKNFPREYQAFLQTSDTSFFSKHNGNGRVDALKRYPAMVILWAGYAFSKDYYQPRGHFYAVEDVRNTLRTGAPLTPDEGPQPATCWSCKSPDVPRMMNKLGIESFYKSKWSALGPEIVNPIGCADCHDPELLNLTITRPALIEAFQRQGKDIKQVSYQEMRSLVCAQCHVEYYFKGDGKYLTFPWDKGTSVEDIEKYYDEAGFTDWTHALSKAPMLKAQHPDYEVFQMGIHAQRGVSCADCHMPYISEGGQKFTDHHLQSPLKNISRSCQVCHRQSEAELTANVYERQDKIAEIRHTLEETLVKAHVEAKAAWEAKATEEQMKDILQLIRKAQWRWDFAAAGHGSSFHAPLEISRIITNGISMGQEARVKLASLLGKLGVQNVTYPDIFTKENAQAYLQYDMKKLRDEKQVFMQKIIPEWIKAGAEREQTYGKQ